MADPRPFEKVGSDFDAMIAKSKAIRLLEAEIARLEMRVEDLLAVNNRYLERARAAEDEATTLRSEIQTLKAPCLASE